MSAIHEKIYDYAVYGSYILYGLALFGITSFAPDYLDSLRNIIKIYISLVLIIRFNPFTNKNSRISKFDKRLVFSSAIFLLLTTSITSLVEYYIFKIVKDTPFNTIANNIRAI